MESYIRSLIDEIFLEDNSDLRKKISSFKKYFIKNFLQRYIEILFFFWFSKLEI